MLTFDQLPDPFVIAEIGGNHEGDFSRACELTRMAVEASAHAVKFQAYAPDRIVSAVASPERNRHFGKFALRPEQYVELAELTRSLGGQFMASLWDREYTELLDPHIEIHKVGSGDLTNYPLVSVLAQKNKPMCVSTAMATMAEVQDAVRFIDSVNPDLRKHRQLCIMHCVATYGEPKDRYANLLAIETLQRELPADVIVGYSDHTIGTVAIEVAVCMGARVIEAHFTDDPSREFRDHHFSKTADELRSFFEFCRRREVMRGSGKKEPIAEIETEARIREFRRAVYFRHDIDAGEIARDDDLTTLRPCEGIAAREYYSVVGRRLRVRKEAYEPVFWDDFEPQA